MSLNLNQVSLLQNVTRYWNNRAEGYSRHNQQELQSIKRLKWQQLLLAHAPKKQNLKVLDIGTGPGFFAIIMAQAGAQVTAIDATSNMLEQAKYNAAQAMVDIRFVRGDVHHLPFADERFDLIISRNVTWNLSEPEQAYKEWHRVLKCGGNLLNFDANWYLFLYDEQRRRAFEQDRATTIRLNIPDHYADTDTSAMEAIARKLPLSRQLRPHWDMNALLNIGFSQLMADTRIGEFLWDDEEKVNYRSTPMFMIVAQK
ncbi:methyltransferase domain-containing protein [Basfia succiniciproducens]|uniref:class I SAM-dependent methyltransferase n=1 Tax=Basfia succiniciproducens TaxID=653940 RepID=UPI003FCEE1B1